jgi:hypothetical protein
MESALFGISSFNFWLNTKKQAGQGWDRRGDIMSRLACKAGRFFWSAASGVIQTLAMPQQ